MGASKAYSTELAQQYDDRHFGGKSGQFILQKDTQALQSLLPPAPAIILDIPCGTGVYMDALQAHGYSILAADASWSMVQIASSLRSDTNAVQSDITQLPIADNSVDAVVTLRLFSHFQHAEIVNSLRELRRVIKPTGLIIFDSFRWTPRRWPIVRHVVEQSFIHEYSPAETEELISAADLRIVGTQWSYLFSPIWQRKLPLPILRALTSIESILPEQWLLRTFWACTKQESTDQH
jgi:ubiquinone/menaquinone biosynthesis C-methylase UbiE